MEEVNEEKEKAKICKKNMKLYSFYRAISADHLFFYAIELIFLVQVKGLTPADVVFGQSCYGFFVILMQLPAVAIIDKIGNRKASSLANIFNATFVFILMFCNNLPLLIIAQFFDGIGFAIKEASDVCLLSNSIPHSNSKGEIFSKIEGKGIKYYYILEAMASLLAGMFYSVNPYIPLIICCLLSIISAIIALLFRETIVVNNNICGDEKIKKYIVNLKESFTFILKSERLKALIVYSGLFWGFLVVSESFTVSYLEEIGATAFIISVYAFIKSVSSAVGSKFQDVFHRKNRNRSLGRLLIALSIYIWTIAIIALLNLERKISIIIILVMTVSSFVIKGLHLVLSTKYLQNFTNGEILDKIYATNTISRNLVRIIVGFAGSYFLKITSIANSITILAIVFSLVTISIILYMKPRVGLNPEEYSDKDIWQK